MTASLQTAPPPTTTRPYWACLLCPGLTSAGHWPEASVGYRTCKRCFLRIQEQLLDIGHRYLMLNPTPGAMMEPGSRGAPGFGSKPAASPHIICLRDPRSSAVAKVWVAGDGRIHQESERPPLSVWNELDGLAWEIIEARFYGSGHDQSTVWGLCTWLDHQLDWVTRQESVVDFERVVRTVDHKLMPLTGDPRIFVCKCPNPIDDGEQLVPCGANLYYPRKGDTIACGNPACRRRWRADEWHSRSSEGLSSMVRALNGLPVDVAA